jgi:hypothetical protein
MPGAGPPHPARPFVHGETVAQAPTYTLRVTTTLRRAAALAPTHPALRWTIQWDPANRAQHRRNIDGTGTVCGLTGRLVLADVADERCTRGCWD